MGAAFDVQPPPADAHPIEQSLFNHVMSGKTIHARLFALGSAATAAAEQQVRLDEHMVRKWTLGPPMFDVSSV